MTLTPEVLDMLKSAFGILAAMIASAATVITILWRGANWVKDEFAKRDAAIVRATEHASAVAQEARDQLAEHRLHAAETFATKSGLKESLDRVHDAVDRLTDRIDLVLRGGSATPRTPRRRSDGE